MIGPMDWALIESWQEREIPLRIVHNDTKINNVMFDNESGKAICVVDLDTVMPGLSLSDFGDMVRTTVSDTEEDERDLSMITFDISRFEAMARGYIASAGAILTKAEKESLIQVLQKPADQKREN